MTQESELPSDYSLYVPDRDDGEPFPIDIDDGVQVDLIEKTGMENMRARLWYFQPGDSVSYHYHDEQEELFYIVKGTGTMIIGEDRERVDIPEGGMIRPSTSTPRHLRNDSDEEAIWLIVGAPAVMEAQLWTEYEEDGTPSQEGEFQDVSEFM
jgi:uncharacterized cupin superfamily protein